MCYKPSSADLAIALGVPSLVDTYVSVSRATSLAFFDVVEELPQAILVGDVVHELMTIDGEVNLSFLGLRDDRL